MKYNKLFDEIHSELRVTPDGITYTDYFYLLANVEDRMYSVYIQNKQLSLEFRTIYLYL